MKLKLIPVLVALLVSSTLLFGGWFMYRGYAMESPLAEIIKHNNGVEQVETHFTNTTLRIDLKLTDEASIREIYQSITTEGASLIGGRTIQLNVDNQSSPAIDAWWSKALFNIAQAMETKQYADIPQVLEEKSTVFPTLKTSTEMDNVNVYIRLSDGKHHKYIILPRVSATVGVWPNE
ncbi:MAG: hypothetical protein K6T85_11355 [Gorillibacterium sp.]|nr:hypothetical protein [Gorillibacterium sp.]